MSSQAFLPFKHVATGLILAVLLGPIGLLYASFWGGVILLFLSFFFAIKQLYISVAFFWLVSCAWSVRAIEKYNHKILKEMRT